jgi:hypothetical protein
MNDWLAQHLIEVVIAALVGLAAWLLRRFVGGVDSHERRIGALEQDRVTREDFDELRASLTATAAHNQERTETRMDRLFEKISELKK